MNPEGKQLHIHITLNEKIIQIPFLVNGSWYRLADGCLFYLTVLSCTHLTLLTVSSLIIVACVQTIPKEKVYVFLGYSLHACLIEALMTTSMVKLFQVCLSIVTLLARARLGGLVYFITLFYFDKNYQKWHKISWVYL